MNKPFGIVVAAALAVGGMAVVGCQNKNADNNPPASVGGVGGGGSTDSYGTSSNARFKSTGNIGVDSGAATAPPAPVRNDTTYGNNPPEPAQTPVAPSGGTGGTGSGVNAPGTGTFQGSTTGNESGAGVRTEVRPPANTSNNNNATGGTSGAAVGGTNGNGTTYNNASRNTGNTGNTGAGTK